MSPPRQTSPQRARRFSPRCHGNNRVATAIRQEPNPALEILAPTSQLRAPVASAFCPFAPALSALSDLKGRNAHDASRSMADK